MTSNPPLRWLIAVCAAVLVTLCLPAVAAAQSAPSPDSEILVMVLHPPDHFRPGSYGGGYDEALARSERDRLAGNIARKYSLSLVDSWPMPMIGMDCFVMAVPEGRSTAAVAEQVSRDSNVAWSEPVNMYRTQSAPASDNDPLYPAQPAAREWRLAELHKIATGRGVRIAVIDSEIESSHPDLAGQVTVNRNFASGHPLVSERHGTEVAGIIAAKANNGIGIAGIAPDAKLLGLRACWQQNGSSGTTVCDSFSLTKALYFAVEQKADVINLSLSGPDDRLLRTLIDAALAHGLTVVAAFDPKKNDGGFPASVPGVIAVADATLARGRPDVYIAPGRDVPTTEPGGRWSLVNGSSFAAAHVSGLVALVRQRRRARVTLVSDRGRGGLIDACGTLLAVARSCDCSCGSTRAAATVLAR